MTDAPGWPDASKPGVPANPAQTGPHWVAVDPGGTPCVVEWNSHYQGWSEGDSMTPPSLFAETWECYLGPCHTPQEVAALVAAGQEAVREACHDAAVDPLVDACGAGAEVDAVLDAILATPIRPTEALAAIRGDARREGMLAAIVALRSVESSAAEQAEHHTGDAMNALDLAEAAIRAAAKEIKP